MGAKLLSLNTAGWESKDAWQDPGLHVHSDHLVHDKKHILSAKIVHKKRKRRSDSLEGNEKNCTIHSNVDKLNVY